MGPPYEDLLCALGKVFQRFNEILGEFERARAGSFLFLSCASYPTFPFTFHFLG